MFGMDNLHYRLKVEITTFFIIVGKRILKLVELQVCWRNVLKYEKYSLAKFATFVRICITCGKTFSRVIQTYANFANFAGLYFSYFTAFYHQTLQFY